MRKPMCLVGNFMLWHPCRNATNIGLGPKSQGRPAGAALQEGTLKEQDLPPLPGAELLIHSELLMELSYPTLPTEVNPT